MPPPKDPEKREQWIVKKRVDAIERWANPEQRKKMVEGMNRPETKAKKSASMQGKNTGPKSEEHKANLKRHSDTFDKRTDKEIEKLKAEQIKNKERIKNKLTELNKIK